MAEASVLSKDEFKKQNKMQEEELDRWLERGLLLAAGRTEGGDPFFTPANTEMVAKIRTLIDLGYDEEAIEKIVRKVGLPVPDDDGSVPQKLMTVGELAQQCSTNTRAINHWEEKGLVGPEARSEGGFRLYGPASVKRCKRVLDLQNVGYTLEQIKSMRQLLESPRALAAGLEKHIDEGDIKTWVDQDKNLKERIDEVRVSLKRLDELLKQRRKLEGGLRAQYEKSVKERQRKKDKEKEIEAPEPSPAKA